MNSRGRSRFYGSSSPSRMMMASTTKPPTGRLAELVRSRDWASVQLRCLTHPADAHFTSRGKTPLHFASQYRAPPPIITALVHIHPKAALARDSDGCTPLHLALLYGADDESCIRLLRCASTLSSAPSTALPLTPYRGPSSRSFPHRRCSPARRGGHERVVVSRPSVIASHLGSALHMACRHGSSTSLLRELIRSDPSMVLAAGEGATSPASLLWRVYRRRNAAALAIAHLTAEATTDAMDPNARNQDFDGPEMADDQGEEEEEEEEDDMEQEEEEDATYGPDFAADHPDADRLHLLDRLYLLFEAAWYHERGIPLPADFGRQNRRQYHQRQQQHQHRRTARASSFDDLPSDADRARHPSSRVVHHVVEYFDTMKLHLDLVKFVVQNHPHELLEPDEHDRLPLHIAAYKRLPDKAAGEYGYPPTQRGHSRVPSNNHNDNEEDAHGTAASQGGGANRNANAAAMSAGDALLSILLESCPVAAAAPDGDGRMPLALAIEGDKSWEGALCELFRANPEALDRRDVQSLLFPFMLAAHRATRAQEQNPRKGVKTGNDGNEKDGGENDDYSNGVTGFNRSSVLMNVAFELIKAGPHLLQTGMETRQQ